MSPTEHHERPTPRVRAFRRESNTNPVFPARLPIGNWSTGARRSSRMHREEHRGPHCRGPLRKTRKAASWKNRKENPTADPRLGCECDCGIRWMCRAKSEATAQSSMAGKILRRRWHTTPETQNKVCRLRPGARLHCRPILARCSREPVFVLRLFLRRTSEWLRPPDRSRLAGRKLQSSGQRGRTRVFPSTIPNFASYLTLALDHLLHWEPAQANARCVRAPIQSRAK